MKISAISNYTQQSYLKSKLNSENKKDTTNYTKNIKVNDSITFEGINAKGLVKQRGLMFHISSLPATRSYCGQFGDIQTINFINWLAKAKQTHWILNPLNALDENLCPYSSLGRFSRNKFLVNLNKLTEKEYGNILKIKELPDDITAPTFTLDMLERQKNPRFELAFLRFKKLPETTPIKKEYNEFLNKNNDLWLEEYASYDLLTKRFKTNNWLKWDKEIQIAPETARKEGVSIKDKIISILTKQDKKLKAENLSNIMDLYKFEQFLYDKQFNEMIDYLDAKKIRLILDLPIGVNSTGVDTWGKKNIFLLDENFNPTKVSGCPPEKNYPYTQVWGHALYDYDSPDFWNYQEASLNQLIKQADLRLDHFVGYINRAEIPTTFIKKDGTILKDGEIFKPTSEGGMGVDFFKKEWIQDICAKKNKNGENIFDLFLRIAKENDKNPEDVYILENFGPLSKTPAYKNFDKKYGKNFISQRVPISMGFNEINEGKDKLNNPFKIKNSNIALLTGNHDLPSLRESVDGIIDMSKKNSTRLERKTHKLFKKFCKEELNLTKEELKDQNAIFENIIKWFYTRDVKQVQTTLQDALKIYYRPNIPGFWNGMPDKFLMKTTAEALLPFWSKVFPKDFLSRDNKLGIEPGYKILADQFVKLMNELYPEK